MTSLESCKFHGLNFFLSYIIPDNDSLIHQFETTQSMHDLFQNSDRKEKLNRWRVLAGGKRSEGSKGFFTATWPSPHQVLPHLNACLLELFNFGYIYIYVCVVVCGSYSSERHMEKKK